MKRLGNWLQPKSSAPQHPWYVGPPQNRGLYEQHDTEGARYVGSMDTEELAQLVTKAVNYYQSIQTKTSRPTGLHGRRVRPPKPNPEEHY